MMLEATRKMVRAMLGRTPFIPSEEAAYQRLRSKDFSPRGVIDIGAYQGSWTRLVRRVFPDVPVLMIEAQEAKLPFLEKVCADMPGVSLVNAVLSATSGESVTFYEMETGSSIMPENSNVPRTERELTTRTLDEVADAIEGPIFLKIDVQGAELKVLAGGSQTLSRTEVVQLEVAMLPYNEGAPDFIETISYMEVCNFVPLDFSGFTRPNGRDLVQVDILFAKRASELRPSFFTF